MNVEEAYRAQLELRARRIVAGDKPVGWKMSLTNKTSRGIAGHPDPLRGFLMESSHLASGASIRRDQFHNPLIEAELCLILGKPLRGPGVTKQIAREAIAAVAAGFEVPDPGMENEMDVLRDLPRMIADNVLHWGFVTGEELRPFPSDFEVADLVVELSRNGDLVERMRSGDKVDDQIETLAWLANHLARYGHGFEVGQYVIGGSITKPRHIVAGERWEARFQGIGTVSLNAE